MINLAVCVFLGLLSNTFIAFVSSQQSIAILSDGENSLRGKRLRVTSVEVPPFVEFEKNQNGNITGGKGFSFEILNALMEAYNFSIVIEVPKDNAYGTLLMNKTWNGMIAMILNNESDIGIGSFSVTHVRYQVIDFTTSYYEESSAIMIPAQLRGMQSSAFTKPFQIKVWIILILILGLLPFIMWIQSKIMENARFSFVRKRRERFLFVYGVVLTQSGQRIPGKEHSLRFLAIIWCLSALVFIHAYIGTLMSFLSVPNQKPILRSLEELPTSGLEWIVWRGSDLESFFMEAKDGVYHIIGDGLRKNPNRLFGSVIEGGQAVINGSFAFMHSKASVESMIEKDFAYSGRKCRASVAKETFYKVNQAFALPKGSLLGPLFNKKILDMMESGLMEHWRNKHLSIKNHCSGSNTRDERVLRKITLHDFKSAFLMWFIGVGIALTAFVAENFYYFVTK